MPKFIDVYAKATGEKHRVPEHFMTVPSIARNFTKTPRQRRREAVERPADTKPRRTRGTSSPTPPAGDKKE